MDIRKDLQEVEGLISRLISIGQELETMDNRWSHMKNNEDFDSVCEIEDQGKKCKIEEVYASGREIAGFLSEALQRINVDFATYPTLTSVIEGFNDTWIDNDLDKIKSEGKEAFDDLGLSLWSFRQMLIMFQDQIDLTKAIRGTLNLLKESDLYKLENGVPVKEKHPTVNISNVKNSNIAVSAENTEQSIVKNENLFKDLIEAIQTSGIDGKEELITAARDLESASGTGGFSESYKSFITLAANHMTLVAPFMPALVALL